MDMTTTPVVSTIVDELGQIKAAIATLRQQEEKLKELLADSGLAVADGRQYRASIARMDGRPSIDWRAIAEHFNPSRQLVTAHTSYGKPFVAVRVSARSSA